MSSVCLTVRRRASSARPRARSRVACTAVANTWRASWLWRRVCASARWSADDPRQGNAGVDSELVVDAGEMTLDGLLAHEQRRGDVPVALARRHECRDLLLTRTQCRAGGVTRCWARPPARAL